MVREGGLPPLVDPDGTGRFNAVLLTSGVLAWSDGPAWRGPEPQFWRTLWHYESCYGVRQVALQTGCTRQPEDYGLRGGTEGPVGGDALLGQLTDAGREVFDLLAPQAEIPVSHSYVYRCTGVAAGAEPLLVAQDVVLAVRSTSVDGRERVALTFTCNEHLLQTHLLGHGLLRWACRGVHLGVRRHVLKVDVDDYFAAGDLLAAADGRVRRGAFLMTARDVSTAAARQAQVRAAHPVAAGFRLALAFNGHGTQVYGRREGYPEFLAATRQLRDEFEWVNHTWAHRNLNEADLPTALAEIRQNLVLARELGLALDPQILKTGEYSGLGVRSDDPTDALAPVQDRGLGQSNPHLLAACEQAGVRFLHGNLSFAGHRPPVVNGATAHPLAVGVFVVPDWPSSLAYYCATPEHQIAYYNRHFGPGGRFEQWPGELDYAQYLAHEVDQTFVRVASGSIHSHTAHIPNLHDYAGGRSLLFDWIEPVVARYAATFRTPLLCPSWTRLAAMTLEHNAHDEGLAHVRAVHDRQAGTVRLTADRPAQVLVTGVALPDAERYGPQWQGVVRLRPGVPVTAPVDDGASARSRALDRARPGGARRWWWRRRP